YHVSRVYCLCFTVPILLLLYLYYSVYTHPPPTQIYTLSLHDALPISCVRQAVRFNDGETARTAKLDELMAEAALADAGRAHDTHREAVPLKGAPQGGVERGHLIVATNEARKSVPRGGLEPSPCRTGADHL